MKTLQPQKLRQKDWLGLEAQVLAVLQELVFGPVIELLRARGELLNAFCNAKGGPEPLLRALRAGTVQYDPSTGEFIGKWNRALSDALQAFGARLDKRTGNYKADPVKVPATVRAEAASYNAAMRVTHEQVSRLLDDLAGKSEKALGYQKFQLKGLVKSVDGGWRESAKGLEVLPGLDEEGLRIFAEKYADTLKITIKDVADDEIAKLRETVKESAEQGYRAETLTTGIRDRLAMGKERARFVARQETSNLMSDYREARFKEAGVTRYKWSTSHDSRVRPTHAHLDGKVFEYDNPPVVSMPGDPVRRANPGRDFRCFPGDERLHLAHGIEKAFRRWYAGDLTEMVTASGKTLRATPNHPVLTQRGWCPIGQLNDSDYIINLSKKLSDSGEQDVDHAVPRIDEVFKTLSLSFLMLPGTSMRQDFHGDGTDGEIDVVDMAGHLAVNGKSGVLQSLRKLIFSVANDLASPLRGLLHDRNTPGLGLCANGRMSSRGERLSSIGARLAHSKEHGLRLISRPDSSIGQTATNYGSGNAKPHGNGQFALATAVRGDDGRIIDGPAVLDVRDSPSSVCYDTLSPQILREVIGMTADDLCGIYKTPAIAEHLDRVVDVRRKDFSGHVYNLTTHGNWYAMGGIIVHNCRCTDIPVLEAVA